MSDLKPCPVCKGQSGGIGSDGVENDCMACFAREVQAASPRVEACIASCLARYHGDSKAAQARYFEEVHQRLAPLARSLEIELAEAKAELARRTQPEATAPATIPKVEIELPAGDPRKVKIHLDTITDGVRWLCCTIESPAAQDLSAAILNWSGIADRLNELDKAIAHSTNLTPQSKPRRLLYAILHEVCSSPANALSAGDRVDAVEVAVKAYADFVAKASYLRHPEVPYMGTAKGDHPDRWKERFDKAAMRSVVCAILQSQNK